MKVFVIHAGHEFSIHETRDGALAFMETRYPGKKCVVETEGADGSVVSVREEDNYEIACWGLVEYKVKP